MKIIDFLFVTAAKPYFFALANLRQRYFSPLTVISRAPSWLSWFDAVPIKTLFSFSRLSLSIFSLASCRAISAWNIQKLRTVKMSDFLFFNCRVINGNFIQWIFFLVNRNIVRLFGQFQSFLFHIPKWNNIYAWRIM